MAEDKKKLQNAASSKRQYSRMSELRDWYFAAKKAAAESGEELELLPCMQEEVDKMLRWYEARRRANADHRARKRGSL